MRSSGNCGAARPAAVALGLALALAAGCDARGLTPDAGAGGEVFPDLLLSDFEDPAGAFLVRSGKPPTRSPWYVYNDGKLMCDQVPAPQVQTYSGEAPPSLTPSNTGSTRALHGFWEECAARRTGIGADLDNPTTANGGGPYAGPRIPYDLSAYKGITFWVMATSGSDTNLRAALPMRAETSVSYGGLCGARGDDDGCGDSWGQTFAIDGSWRQVSIKFASAGFAQQGWGGVVPWDPRDVIGIQFQAVDDLVPYDFWLDDVYLIY